MLLALALVLVLVLVVFVRTEFRCPLSPGIELLFLWVHVVRTDVPLLQRAKGLGLHHFAAPLDVALEEMVGNLRLPVARRVQSAAGFGSCRQVQWWESSALWGRVLLLGEVTLVGGGWTIPCEVETECGVAHV